MIDYTGISVAKFMSAQKAQLIKLIKLYVNNLNDGHARLKMEQVERYVDTTYFAWIGGLDHLKT